MIRLLPDNGNVGHDIGTERLIVYKIFILIIMKSVMFFQVAKTLRIAPFQGITGGYTSGYGILKSLHLLLIHLFVHGSQPAAKSGKDQQEDKNRDDNITQI